MQNDNDNIVIEQSGYNKKHKTITELFENYDSDYSPEEIDWGEPVVKEILSGSI